MLPIAIGLAYGVLWYALHMFMSRYIASKTTNPFVVGLVPLIFGAFFLVSVILFKPLFSNWQAFIHVWGISFAVGALAFKFGIQQRYYR